MATSNLPRSLPLFPIENIIFASILGVLTYQAAKPAIATCTAFLTDITDLSIPKWLALVIGTSLALNGYLLQNTVPPVGTPSAPTSAAAPAVAPTEAKVESPLPPSILRSRSGSVPRFSEPEVTAKIPSPFNSRPPSRNLKLSNRAGFTIGLPSPISSSPSGSDEEPALPVKSVATPAPAPQVVQVFVPGSSKKERSPEDEKVAPARPFEELVSLLPNPPNAAALTEVLGTLTNEEVVTLVKSGKVAAYALEKVLGGGVESPLPTEQRNEKLERAVAIRRGVLCRFSTLPCIF